MDSWGYKFGETDEMNNVKVEPGNIVGCMFDQSDYPAVLKYTRDGESISSVAVTGMKGALFPAISLAAGGEAEVIFDSSLFNNSIPEGFSPIIVANNFSF